MVKGDSRRQEEDVRNLGHVTACEKLGREVGKYNRVLNKTF